MAWRRHDTDALLDSPKVTREGSDPHPFSPVPRTPPLPDNARAVSAPSHAASIQAIFAPRWHADDMVSRHPGRKPSTGGFIVGDSQDKGVRPRRLSQEVSQHIRISSSGSAYADWLARTVPRLVARASRRANDALAEHGEDAADAVSGCDSDTSNGSDSDLPHSVATVRAANESAYAPLQVYTSTLQRSLDTARPLARAMGVPVQPLSALNVRHRSTSPLVSR